MGNLIEIRDLTYYYPGNPQPALQQINLRVRAGEILGIMGVSGCGKSTLLRGISRLIPDFYGGKLAGEIFFRQTRLRDWNSKDLYRTLGVVTQEAENHLIFNEVNRDIAFGLENLGKGNQEMQERVGEMLEYFGLNELTHRSVHRLSGGEKQKTALAGIVAMQPELLVLDEPGAQLDENSARELFTLLGKMHRELGITIIIAEQRLELLAELADRIMVMDEGTVVFTGTPREQRVWALEKDYSLILDQAVDKARSRASRRGEKDWRAPGAAPGSKPSGCLPTVKLIDLGFAYGEVPVLKDMNLWLYPGQITALTGGNGCGKTTLIKLMLGLLKANQGRIEILGLEGKQLRPEIIGRKVAYLPQNLGHYFITDNTRAEVELGAATGEINYDTATGWLERFNILKYADADPRSLSTGEKQRVAIASALAGNPQLVFMDEPTRGLDLIQKQTLGNILLELAEAGKTVVIAAHDRDLVENYADRILVMHQGSIIKDNFNPIDDREAL